MPDAHSGYGFSIGGVAAMDMRDPKAVVCPGGVGFDINCGVCAMRTNLMESDLADVATRDRLAKELFDRIPVGVGSRGSLGVQGAEFDNVLRGGLRWLAGKELAWPEDCDCCEEGGCISLADPDKGLRAFRLFFSCFPSPQRSPFSSKSRRRRRQGAINRSALSAQAIITRKCRS